MFSTNRTTKVIHLFRTYGEKVQPHFQMNSSITLIGIDPLKQGSSKKQRDFSLASFILLRSQQTKAANLCRQKIVQTCSETFNSY